MTTPNATYHPRHKRRLPRIQRPGRLQPLSFWPTYRGALEWLRRHQAIIDTALSLLDIYPSLIQETALDQLWEFLVPFFSRIPKERSTDTSRSGKLPSNNDNASRTRGHNINGRSTTNSNRSVDSGRAASITSNRSKLRSPGEPGRVSSTISNRTPSSFSIGRAESENSNITINYTAAGRDMSPAPNGLTHTGNEPHVPVISITYASDENDSEVQSPAFRRHHHQQDSDDDRLSEFGEGKTPRVYVSCLCNDQMRENKLHSHVLHALQHEFYVKTGPCTGEDNRQAKTNDNREPWYLCEDFLDADACVFVLDDPSLNSPLCFQSLCAARAHDIPTVFLKDSNYSLPTMLPDTILQHNLGLDSRSSTPSFRPPQNATLRSGRRPVSSSNSLSSSRGVSPTSRRLGHRRQKYTQQQEDSTRDSDMILHLLNGYRNALVFENTRYEDCEAKLKKKVHSILGTGLKERQGRAGKSSSMSKSRNTLYPVARRSDNRSPRPRQRTAFLGLPKAVTNPPWRHEAKLDGGLFDDDEEEEDGFLYPARSPSEMSISLSNISKSNMSFSESNSRPHSTNSLAAEPLYSLICGDGHADGNSRAISCENAPLTLNVMLPVPPGSPPCRSTRHSSSSRPYSHLHQLQQQLQEDRATFLSSVSPMADEVMVSPPSLENFEGRQTTYLVCSKTKLHPNREPRLVKWPPSPRGDGGGPEAGDEEESDVQSDTFSESPASFKNYRDLDLSMVVNKPRGADTPDSDASTIF